MKKPKAIPKIPKRRVIRQEALFARLQLLARTVQGEAARRPRGAVSDAVRVEAETLLYETEPFRERQRRGALPPAAPHYGALASQLAEALTALIAFETRNTHWDAVRLETLWSAIGEAPIVKRLQPRPGSRAAAQKEAKAQQELSLRDARSAELRRLLIERLTQFYSRERPQA